MGDRGGRGARNVGYGRAAGGYGAGRIDVEAKVVQDTPGVDATGEPRAGGEPRVDADVDEVVRVDLLPVMRRLRHHVLDLSEFVLVDVVQAAHLVPAPARKPRIDRRGDAVRTVVRLGHRQVVGGPEVARPIAVVTGVHRQPRPKLLLHLRPDVPEIIADAEAVKHIVGPNSGRRVVLAKVLIIERPALSVRAEIAQVAVRNVVPVGIIPRAGRRVDGRGDRIE